MVITEVTPPAAEPVLIADLKKHLQIDASFTDDDSYIEGLQLVARRHAEAVTRRKLITQTWQVFLQEWPYEDYIVLPFGKLQTVTHVKYTDSGGTVNTDFDEGDEWTKDVDSDPGRVVLSYGESYPNATLATNNPIEAQFVCGYGVAGTNVPDEILMAIKLMTAELYERRETNIVGVSVAQLDTFDNMLRDYRLWW